MGVKGTHRDFDAGRRILKYMREHPGQDMHFRDVAEAVNADPDNTCTMLARTVQRHPEYGVERVGSGTYRFLPQRITELHSKTDNSKLYEVLGFMGDDVMVVRDDGGEMSLWRKVDIP
jgi:hypothetical protein